MFCCSTYLSSTVLGNLDIKLLVWQSALVSERSRRVDLVTLVVPCAPIACLRQFHSHRNLQSGLGELLIAIVAPSRLSLADVFISLYALVYILGVAPGVCVYLN